jgi:4-amino-4-deoxy-L-arabinose transferase-like glycosyltransferase
MKLGVPSQPLGTGPALAWTSTGTPTVILVLLLFLARLIYLAFLCPYTLIEDEAHYWEWSRHLDWSYYSKGPGVAWTIWLTTHAFPHAAEFAIRSSAPFVHAVTALALATLASDGFQDRRVGFITALLFNLLPGFQIAGTLFVIDMPFCACWSLAMLAAYRAFFHRSAWAWIALGAALGIGFIYKYTILLLLPGLAHILFWDRSNLKLHPRWQISATAAVLIAATGLIPVILWNSAHDWPTLRHLLGHLGVSGGDTPVVQGAGKGWSYQPTWTIDFLIAQFGISGPVLLLALLGTRRGMLTTETADLARRFLFWLAAPLLTFYLLVSLLTEPEGNWSIAAHLSLVILAAAVVVHTLDAAANSTSTRLNPTRFLWHASLLLGIFSGIFMLRLDLIDRALAAVGAPDSLRRVIPMSRMSGADLQAAHIQRLLNDLPPSSIVIAKHYGRASQAAFYLPAQPIVYCASAHMDGGRKTQYDIWPFTNLADPETSASLLGKNAVLLGGTLSDWQPWFGSVHEIGTLDGDRKRGRPAFIGAAYRGIPAPQGAPK